MIKTLKEPLFYVGLLFRIFLLLTAEPILVSSLYAPFLSMNASNFSLDPWGQWINHGGSSLAFPYGYSMWLCFLPASLLCKYVGISLIYGYNLTLLFADFFLLNLIQKLLPNKTKLILIFYWLSPIVIIATFGFGLNDIIPAIFLMLAILAIKKSKFTFAGAFCAIAISAKLSMVIALPLFIIYIYNNKSLRPNIISFLKVFFIAFSLLFIPFAMSLSALAMLFGNPEVSKILNLQLDLGKNFIIYIVPLAYSLILYFFWKLNRSNFDLFCAATGITFLSILILTPASLGWFIWAIPFLIIYQSTSGITTQLLVTAFSFLYLLNILQFDTLHFLTNKDFIISSLRTLPQAQILIQTCIVAIGLLLTFRFWVEAIAQNDFFRLSRKPFLIGISGDSASGKDTCAKNIAGIFGEQSTLMISGDAYHLWDRKKPIWQIITHLNPTANDLEKFLDDLISLKDGNEILSRQYDHNTGKLTKMTKIRSNDVIIASGLHTLSHPVLRNYFDLKIYLDIDEDLRRFFKIKRDTKERNHSSSDVLKDITQRQSDSIRFIHPQMKYADLVFSLQPIHSKLLRTIDLKIIPRLKLAVTASNGFNSSSLHRILVGVCGLHVDIEVLDDGSNRMTIEGDVSPADIEQSANILCKRLIQFLDISPSWESGMSGLTQLISLYYINQLINKRLLE